MTLRTQADRPRARRTSFEEPGYPLGWQALRMIRARRAIKAP